MIAGLEMPTAGTIHIGDQVAFSLDQGRSMPPSKRGLGLVFQSYALWPHLTVAQNITFGLEVQRVGKAETEAAARRGRRRAADRRVARTATPASSPAASSSAWRSPACS